MNQVIGIDVSKKTFDVSYSRDQRAVFGNDTPGVAAFIAALEPSDHVVMEATGTYFLKLATRVHDAGFNVTVVNPAVITYFARMRLARAKTARADAEIIRQYGQHAELPRWAPTEDIFIELNQLDSHLNGLQRDRNAVIGRLEALRQCETISELVAEDLQSQLDDLVVRIKRCEKVLVQQTEHHFPELISLLRSIQGVGKRTAVMFIVLTRGFTRFESAKSFVAYLGLSSFIKTSGTSVRGSGAISKMGNPRMRQLLYMAALTAKRRNRACQEFAQRLTDNGKPPKVVRIAVANKLIRQAFAVCSKQQPYSESYA